MELRKKAPMSTRYALLVFAGSLLLSGAAFASPQKTDVVTPNGNRMRVETRFSGVKLVPPRPYSPTGPRPSTVAEYRRSVRVSVAYHDVNHMFHDAKQIEVWTGLDQKLGTTAGRTYYTQPLEKQLVLKRRGDGHYVGAFTKRLDLFAGEGQIIQGFQFAPHVGHDYDSHGPGQNTKVSVDDPGI
jgi:hypothetical protein